MTENSFNKISNPVSLLANGVFFALAILFVLSCQEQSPKDEICVITIKPNDTATLQYIAGLPIEQSARVEINGQSLEHQQDKAGRWTNDSIFVLPTTKYLRIDAGEKKEYEELTPIALGRHLSTGIKSSNRLSGIQLFADPSFLVQGTFKISSADTIRIECPANYPILVDGQALCLNEK